MNCGAQGGNQATSESSSLSDYTSIGIGANGTISGGTVTSLTTQTISDSHSIYENGTEYVADPEGGPPFFGAITQSSVTTSYASNVNQGGESLGAHGAITGGGNSFTFIQNDFDSQSETFQLSSGMGGQINTASMYENMLGTETYASGGSISGGSDSYTWIQGSNDDDNIYEATDNGTIGSAPYYNTTVIDSMSDSLSDYGTDTLGASDSILGGCDTYVEIEERSLYSGFADFGTSAAPILDEGSGADVYYLTDTGSSTLTTNGHVHGSDSFTDFEQSEETAAYSEAEGSVTDIAYAYDEYYDTDNGTQTISDTTTNTYDSFLLLDTHYFSANELGTATNSTQSENWSDIAQDDNTLTASGTNSTTTGDTYYFLDTDSNGDQYILTKVVPGQFNVVLTQDDGGQYGIQGSTTLGAAGPHYSYVSSTVLVSTDSESGNTTYGTTITPFSFTDIYRQTIVLDVTGPPPYTATVESNTYNSSSGTNPGVDTSETLTAGDEVIEVAAGAAVAGGYAINSAVHDGTVPPPWDTEKGLDSAVGGQDVHPLTYTGVPIMPIVVAGGTSMVLGETSYASRGSNPETNWVSHPGNRLSPGRVDSGEQQRLVHRDPGGRARVRQRHERRVERRRAGTAHQLLHRRRGEPDRGAVGADAEGGGAG